jgi:hypothetical protein
MLPAIHTIQNSHVGLIYRCHLAAACWALIRFSKVQSAVEMHTCVIVRFPLAKCLEVSVRSSPAQ